MNPSITADDRWSLGTLIWLPAAAVLLIALVVCTWLMFRAWRVERKDNSTYSEAGLFLSAVVTGVLCIVALIGGTAWGMWPYEAEYHQWRETTGTVQAIDSRLLADGNGGATERFVVTFEDGEQRSCDDTRCAQVEEGDVLTLACKQAWQWSGTHGFDCNYVSHRSVR